MGSSTLPWRSWEVYYLFTYVTEDVEVVHTCSQRSLRGLWGYVPVHRGHRGGCGVYTCSQRSPRGLWGIYLFTEVTEGVVGVCTCSQRSLRGYVHVHGGHRGGCGGMYLFTEVTEGVMGYIPVHRGHRGGCGGMYLFTEVTEGVVGYVPVHRGHRGGCPRRCPAATRPPWHTDSACCSLYGPPPSHLKHRAQVSEVTSWVLSLSLLIQQSILSMFLYGSPYPALSPLPSLALPSPLSLSPSLTYTLHTIILHDPFVESLP